MIDTRDVKAAQVSEGQSTVYTNDEGETLLFDAHGLTLSSKQSLESLSIPLLDPNAAVAVGSDGYIYLSQTLGASGEIQKYDPEGAQVTTGGFPISTTATAGLAFDSAGYLYGLNRTTNQVHKYDPAGASVTTWSTTGTPTRICINSADQVYVYDEDNDFVRRFTTAGTETLTGHFPFAPPSTTFAIDSSDQLVFPDVAGVDRYDANANATTNVTGPAFTGNIAVGPDGAFYGESNSGHNIDKYDAAGAFVGTISSDSQLFALAIDGDSQIYAVDAERLLLHVFTGIDVLRATVLVQSGDGRVLAHAAVINKLDVNHISSTNGTVFDTPVIAPLAFQSGTGVVATTAAATQSVSVAFPTAFATAPKVSLGVTTATPNLFQVGHDAPTTTGFTIYLYRASGSGDVSVDWTAIAQ